MSTTNHPNIIWEAARLSALIPHHPGTPNGWFCSNWIEEEDDYPLVHILDFVEHQPTNREFRIYYPRTTTKETVDFDPQIQICFGMFPDKLNFVEVWYKLPSDDPRGGCRTHPRHPINPKWDDPINTEANALVREELEDDTAFLAITNKLQRLQLRYL